MQQETVTRTGHLFEGSILVLIYSQLYCLLRPEDNLKSAPDEEAFDSQSPSFPVIILERKTNAIPTKDLVRGRHHRSSATLVTDSRLVWKVILKSVKIISRANIGAHSGRGADHAWWGFENPKPNPNPNPNPTEQRRFGQTKNERLEWSRNEPKREDWFLCPDL